MIKTSCVPRLAGDTFLVIRTSYVRICKGDVTAAAMIHIFEMWHNTKIAGLENHIDMTDHPAPPDYRTPAPTLWQYHKSKDLEAQLVGIGKRHSIDIARKLLADLGIVEIGRNPNKRYKFDATTFYLFKPEVLTGYLKNLTDPSAENSSGPLSKTASTTAEISKAIPKDSYSDSTPKEEGGASAPAPVEEPMAETVEEQPELTAEEAQFKNFKEWAEESAPRIFKMKQPMTAQELGKLKQKYSSAQIADICAQMHNWQPLTRKNISTYLTAEAWLKKDQPHGRLQKNGGPVANGGHGQKPGTSQNRVDALANY